MLPTPFAITRIGNGPVLALHGPARGMCANEKTAPNQHRCAVPGNGGSDSLCSTMTRKRASLLGDADLEHYVHHVRHGYSLAISKSPPTARHTKAAAVSGRVARRHVQNGASGKGGGRSRTESRTATGRAAT